MKLRAGVALGITVAAPLAMPASAGAEEYQMDCLIAGAVPTQLAAIVSAESPALPVTVGETFTLPDLFVEFDPSIEAPFPDGTLTILGEAVPLGEESQDGPDRVFWGPQDVELTAPTQAGTHDLVPQAFGVTFVTPEASLPIACEFPGAEPFATLEVVAGDEPPQQSTTTTMPDDNTPTAPPARPVRGDPNFTG